MANWLALVIGNTRWHWAWFAGSELKQVWHHPHISYLLQPSQLGPLLASQGPPQLLDNLNFFDIWAVSVVPPQTQYLQPLKVHWITDTPLKKVYSTLGLDRAVTLWGAGQKYGWPVLVIDGGTALTFTAGAEATFVGGAILLGLRSHFTALQDYTAALPAINPPSTLPPRWARDTASNIQGGIIYTLLDSIHLFIQCSHRQLPD
ncbi:MAG: type III pantothenate kinase, partial [Symploca sp. SIO2G7]|nr:type III pantothenate kinase [Symploca sp. SIO2G7]